MVKVGLVGCGAIGSKLAKEIQRRFRGTARLIGIYDWNLSKAKKLGRQLSPSVSVLPIKSLISRADLLVEAASAQAAADLLPQVIARKKSLLALSTGGVLRSAPLLRKALQRRVPIYLPSGAIAGIDGVKAAAIGKLESVTLTTRKPPASFSNAPGVARRKLNLKGIRKPTVIFEGSAAQAVAAFPQNINVAATLSLAGFGPKKTKVRIVADPNVKRNIHEIEVKGSFGKFSVRTENKPSRENPKTSELAILSAVATLKQILQPIRVGT